MKLPAFDGFSDRLVLQTGAAADLSQETFQTRGGVRLDVGDPEGIRINGISKYDEFGNFNFGATGAAERIPEGALLRAAGRAQQDDPDPNVRAAGKGVAVPRWIDIFSNKGEAPYGDKPQDQVAIKRGIAYFDCRRVHPR